MQIESVTEEVGVLRARVLRASGELGVKGRRFGATALRKSAVALASTAGRLDLLADKLEAEPAVAQAPAPAEAAAEPAHETEGSAPAPIEAAAAPDAPDAEATAAEDLDRSDPFEAEQVEPAPQKKSKKR